MTEYALLIDGSFKEIRNYAEQPEDIPHKGVTWHPVNRTYGSEAFTGLSGSAWVIQEVDPSLLPTPIPYAITPRQMRLILAQQGLLDQVNTMLAQAPESDQIDWEYASEMRRDWPLVTTMAAQLGLSSEQVDQMFLAASIL